MKENSSGKVEKNVRNDNHTKLLCDFENQRIVSVQRKNESNRNLNSKEK